MKTKDKRVGLKPKERKLATTTKKTKLTANQWQATPQQVAFMEAWLDPGSVTFGNAYKSAISVKYSPHYASQIASPPINNKWIQEYVRKLNLTEEHIKQGISKLAIRANNSRSPDDTRLKAYETLAKIHGLIDNKGSSSTVVVVQPILGGESVKRDVIDVDSTPV